MNRFRITTQVLPEHIDNLGHVNNIQYLYWVQTAAYTHWEELAKMITEPIGVWVVRSHSIIYKNPAFEGEKLTLETYVKQCRGVLSERIVEIYNPEQILITRCSTQWCYLDTNNQKPTPIPNIIMELFE